MKSSIYSARILWLIFLTIFIDMLGIGILIPVFPLLIIPHSEFNIIPANWDSAAVFVMAGWLLAAYPLAQFIFSPLLGQFSDKYGRRKVLAISIVGTAFSYILFAVGIHLKNIPLMFLSRIFDGATGGNIAIAQAIIGDISKPADRAKNFGLVGVAIGIGFVFGPFVGGKLSDPLLVSSFNAATPFYFAAFISFINALLVISLLPETLQKRCRVEIELTRPFANIVKAFTNIQLRNIIPVVFLFNAGFTFFTTFWGVILVDEFLFSQGQVGNFFAYMGIMIILAQGMFVRRLSGKVADYKVLRFSLIGTACCLSCYYLISATHPLYVYLIPPFLAVFTALNKAFSNSLISRVTPAAHLGEAMGINSSANALANALPALFAGYIAAEHVRLPILVGALVTFVAWLFFVINYKKYQN